MIYSLKGTVLEKTSNSAVIECGGVGYFVYLSVPTVAALPAVGAEGRVFTYMAVSENDVALYGFSSTEERTMFTKLIAVSGVGAKVGIAVLSAMRVEDIILAAGAEDHKAFTVVSGVGPKLAKRLVLEMKDKVAKDFTSIGLSPAQGVQATGEALSGPRMQAVAALASLGYTQSEAAKAVATVQEDLPVQEIIRLALKSMGTKN